MIRNDEFGSPMSPPRQLILAAIAICLMPIAANKALAQTDGESQNALKASDSREPTDLFSTVLIAADLQDATQIMTIHDPNEDGYIDKVEQRRLAWQAEIPQYDLNKDAKLTHLEVAVRQAKLRSDSGVTQFDRNNANRFMQRKDLNGNGQLDPDEIALGWPADPKSMDKNGDGIITLTEMAEQFAYNRGYRRFIGIEAVDQMEAIRLRNQFDANQDGKLAPSEWPVALLPSDPIQFDENGDGLLSIDEIAAGLAKHRMDTGLSSSDQANARQLIRAADLNQDGVATQEELQQSASFNLNAKDSLTKYDTNSDGEVSLLEIENLLAAERRQKGFSDEDFAEAQRLLARHDVNRSRFLEKDELLEVAGAGQLSADQMRLIDTNKDEKLAVEEIAKYLAIEKQKQENK